MDIVYRPRQQRRAQGHPSGGGNLPPVGNFFPLHAAVEDDPRIPSFTDPGQPAPPSAAEHGIQKVPQCVFEFFFLCR